MGQGKIVDSGGDLRGHHFGITLLDGDSRLKLDDPDYLPPVQ